MMASPVLVSHEINTYDFGLKKYVLEQDVITDATVDAFLHGNCHMLALAIHLKTGLPLVIMTTSKSNRHWEGHAVVQMGENAYLDILGIRSFEDMQEDFSVTLKKPRKIVPEKFTQLMFGISRPHNGLNFLGEKERDMIDSISNLLIIKHLPVHN